MFKYLNDITRDELLGYAREWMIYSISLKDNGLFDAVLVKKEVA